MWWVWYVVRNLNWENWVTLLNMIEWICCMIELLGGGGAEVEEWLITTGDPNMISTWRNVHLFNISPWAWYKLPTNVTYATKTISNYCKWLEILHWFQILVNFSTWRQRRYFLVTGGHHSRWHHMFDLTEFHAGFLFWHNLNEDLCF